MTGKTSKGLDFNRPTFVALMFILGALSAGLFSVVGLLLSYAWSGRSAKSWEMSHYIYLMRGFWLSLAANLVAIVIIRLGLFTVGAGMLAIVALWSLVRAIMSFANAVRRDPMPEPLTYAF